MDAGREMDALVAEKVMGWSEKINAPVGWACSYPSALRNPKSGDVICVQCQVKSYSTNIDEAWEVVEKLKEEGDVFIEYWSDKEWTVSNKPVGHRENGFVVSAKTAPMAICLAALKAVGHEF